MLKEVGKPSLAKFSIELFIQGPDPKPDLIGCQHLA